MAKRRERKRYTASDRNTLHDKRKLPKYAAELERLDAKYDGITPRQLVDEARDPRSVFHSEFEWDSRKAAEAYRRWQARSLIGWIRIETTIQKQKGPRWMTVSTETTRAFRSVPGIQGRAYKTRARALSDPLYQAELQRNCLDDLARLIDRMAEVPALRDLRLAIAAALRSFNSGDEKRKTG